MKRISIFIILILCNLNIFSQISEEVVLYNAGKLNEYNFMHDYWTIDSLILSGTVNNDDLKFIRNRMLSVSYLDLNGAIITEIHDSIFFDNDDLREIILPEELQTIGICAFQNCINLERVVFNRKLTTIMAFAFHNSGLEEVKFPRALKIIRTDAFSNCPNLRKIETENADIWAIPYSSFRNCPALREVVYGNVIEVIEENSFMGNIGLTEINMTDKIIGVNDFAYDGCIGLTAINWTDSFMFLGNYSFNRCIGLKELNFPQFVPRIVSGTFAYCSGLLEVNFNENMDSIASSAFKYCTGLRKIDLSKLSKLETIGWDAFTDCYGLTELHLPANLISIGENAFWKCINLKEIYNDNQYPIDIDSTVFGHLDRSKCVLYVPPGSMNLYKNAEVWKDFYIEEKQFITNIDIYSSNIKTAPNPVTTELQILNSGNDTITSVEIIDINGNILEALNNGNNTISTNHLPNGVYYLRLYSSNDANIYFRKFIKN